MQMKRQLKSHVGKHNDPTNTSDVNLINMIFVVGTINGQLKIYHNETSCLGPRKAGGAHSNVFDDDDEDSPRRR